MKKMLLVFFSIVLITAAMPTMASAAGSTVVSSTIVLPQGVTTTYTDHDFIVNSPITLFELTGDNTKLVLNNCTITYTVGGTGSSSSLSAKAIVVEIPPTGVYTGIGIELNDTTIVMQGDYSRGITFMGGAEGIVTLNNSKILFETAPDANSTYSRGISVYQDEPGALALNLNNSEISGCYYPLNFGSTPYGAMVNVNNTKLEGYCALNVWASNTIINVTNGSELIGRNYYSGSSSDYGVIVFSSSGTTGSSVVVTDSIITVIATGTCTQLVGISAGTSVNATLGSGTVVRYPEGFPTYYVAGSVYGIGEAAPTFIDGNAEFVAYSSLSELDETPVVNPRTGDYGNDTFLPMALVLVLAGALFMVLFKLRKVRT